MCREEKGIRADGYWSTTKVNYTQSIVGNNRYLEDTAEQHTHTLRAHAHTLRAHTHTLRTHTHTLRTHTHP